MRFATTCLVFSLSLFVATAHADTFGSGANTFDIEFVSIRNPGNAADTNDGDSFLEGIQNFGSVDYSYRIGKYEISEQMIEKANASGGLDITKYARGPYKPATSVTWLEVAKFVNWLNFDAGSTPAYKFDGSGNFQLWEPGDIGYNTANLYRNRKARYFLPSVDEWYKAAYFDPSSSIYYDFPTGKNSVPDGIDFPGDPIFDAVFDDGGANGDPNDVTNVGVQSPYGTAGQGGNVWEWEETDYDLVNDSNAHRRAIRGANWNFFIYFLHASNRIDVSSSYEGGSTGFRVASTIPEPNTALLGVCVSLGLLTCRKRLSR